MTHDTHGTDTVERPRSAPASLHPAHENRPATPTTDTPAETAAAESASVATATTAVIDAAGPDADHPQHGTTAVLTTPLRPADDATPHDQASSSEPPTTTAPPTPTADTTADPHPLRRFFAHVGLGFLVPGTGLLRVGRPRLGWSLIAMYLGGIALAVLFILHNDGSPMLAASALLTNPAALIVVLTVHVIGLALWCYSLVLTGRLSRPAVLTPGKAFATDTLITFLCLLLITPTVGASYYVLAGSNALGEIDGDNLGSGDRPTLAGRGYAWANVPRVNVLILGSDAYGNRPGWRSDTIMVASIDTASGATNLISVPRNLQGFSLRSTNPLHKYFPNGKPSCGLECMINAMPEKAAEHRTEFPLALQANAETHTLGEIVADLLGLTINHVVVVNINGMAGLIDAVGGLNVNVKQRLPIGGRVENGYIVPGSISGWIEPGQQHLDGYQAMWFARSRATTDDFERMKRQQCTMKLLVKEIKPTTIMTRFNDMMEVARTNVKTDMNLSLTSHDGLPAWLQLMDRVRTAHIATTSLSSENGVSTTKPDYDQVHAMVSRVLAGGPAVAPTTEPAPTETTPGRRRRNATSSAPTTPATTPSTSPTGGIGSPSPAPTDPQTGETTTTAADC